jgi:hypothetical protein
MKKSKLIKIIAVSTVFILGPSFGNSPSIIFPTSLGNHIGLIQNIKKSKNRKKFKSKSFGHFIYSLGEIESGNNWTAYNKWGYMGKYQFGNIALRDLGYDGCFTFEEFKNDPEVFPEWLQDELIVKYIEKNKRYLHNYIKKYSGDIVSGIYITESSILAAAHLVGNSNTTKWFINSGKVDIKDGNGVSIEHYLKLFSGYQIN